MSDQAPADLPKLGFHGDKRRNGSKLHLAVDTLGEALALLVTPANAQDRAQVAALAAAVQDVTGGTVEAGFVDQGDSGAQAAADAGQCSVKALVSS